MSHEAICCSAGSAKEHVGLLRISKANAKSFLKLAQIFFQMSERLDRKQLG